MIYPRGFINMPRGDGRPRHRGLALVRGIKDAARLVLALLALAASVSAPASGQSVETANMCFSTTDDPCLRVGDCSIQGATWPQEVHAARSDIFDTQGWPGLCDMVHVALVQGDCFPGGQFDLIVPLSEASHAWVSEIVGPLACSGASTPVCNDGWDNDGDGQIDLVEDSGCLSADDFSERAACGDHVDNDLDGAVDASEDLGCADSEGIREDPQCQDGIDNDGQTGTDFDGGESILGVGNGDANGADPQCVGSPWKNREKKARRCGLGFELALPMAALSWLSGRRRRV